MVKTTENGALVAPFLMKCYEMVDDESTDALISWTSNGESFLIHDVTQFEGELLPKYFKHNNFSSFVRQLNIYGFKKIDTDRWEFANDQFLKGQKHMLANIGRRKHSQATGQRKSLQQKETNSETLEEENKNAGLWKEVETLKTDKIALTQELSKLRQHQENSQSRLVFLREQLKGMEINQQQMLSFIVMAMQNPGFFVQVLQPQENNWRMPEAGKRVLKQVTDDRDLEPSNGAIIKYQPPTPEPSSVPVSLPVDDMPDFLKDIELDRDFLARFMNDTTSSPLENHGPHFLPNLPGDDSSLEELLMTSPMSKKNMEDDDAYDYAELFEPGTGIETSTNTLEIATETPNELLDESPSVETVTEQMGHLASKSDLIQHHNYY